MTELDQLKNTLAACRARRLALESYRNAASAHRAAKAASSAPRKTLGVLLGELQALRADAAKATATASAKATRGALADVLALTSAEAEKVTMKALDHKAGATLRATLREAYRSASPRQKAGLWATFRRALTAFPSEK
jgi:hypothetical protein